MMIASRFRPVGWVAAVAVAALGCYLVSLRVATKRGEVAGIEAQILSTRTDMRQLETELGTRSRLVQLERWNSQVLALSAPRVGQYLTSETQLASLGAMPDTPAGPAGTPGDGAVQQASYQPPVTAVGRAAARAVVATPAPAAAPVVRTVATRATPKHEAKVELVSAAGGVPRPHATHAVVKASVKLAHRPRIELTSAAADAKPHVIHTVVRATAKPAHRPHVELASASDDDDTPALLHRTNYVKLGAGRASGRQVALLDDTALGAIERAARQETGDGKKQRR